MKRFIIIILAATAAAMGMAGCGQTNTPPDNPAVSGGAKKKISVISTVFAPYDFAREIAGDNAEITLLLPPGMEGHSYEPTPRDVIKIQGCDIFIYVGGNSDAWISEVLSSMDTGPMKTVTLMDCVEAVRQEHVEGMEDGHGNHGGGESVPGHGHAEEEAEYDEHVWTSPKNARLIVERIYDALCEVDSANANEYGQNRGEYLTKLDGLDEKFQNVVDNAARKTIVFGDRFPFRYLTDAYGLEYYAAFPGCSAETEPSAATVAFLIDKIKAEDIPAVFHIEFSSKKMADAISEATGAKALLLHSCHNVSMDELQSGASYLGLMAGNADALKEALQ